MENNGRNGVYRKIWELQKACRSLAPNTNGPKESGAYPYVSGAKLLSVVRPKMDELGLILTQEIAGITNTPITYNTRAGQKTEMFTSLDLRFTWIDTEDGSTLVNEFKANGMNSWDKGLGSALTYAERYYLLKTLHIATDKDDIDALQREEAQSIAQAPKPSIARTPKKTAINDVAFGKLLKRIEDGEDVLNTARQYYLFTPEQEEKIQSYL